MSFIQCTVAPDPQIYGAELYVTAFQQTASLRHALMDHVLAGLLPNSLTTGRKLQRSYAVGPGGSSNIQIVSALLVQMLQVGQ